MAPVSVAGALAQSGLYFRVHRPPSPLSRLHWGCGSVRAAQVWGLTGRALSVVVFNAPHSVHTQKTKKKPCALASLYFLHIDLKLVRRGNRSWGFQHLVEVPWWSR